MEGYVCVWGTKGARSTLDVGATTRVMIGDFNEAMWSFEHFSQTRRREKQIEDFREVLSQCDLHDLGFSGLP